MLLDFFEYFLDDFVIRFHGWVFTYPPVTYDAFAVQQEYAAFGDAVSFESCKFRRFQAIESSDFSVMVAKDGKRQPVLLSEGLVCEWVVNAYAYYLSLQTN